MKINVKLPLKNEVITNLREIPLTNGSFWKITENTAKEQDFFFKSLENQRAEVILKINKNFVNQDLKPSFLDGSIVGKIPLTNEKVENSRKILFTKK